LLKNRDDLLSFGKNEEGEIKELVDGISKSNIVLCNGKIDDIFMDYFNRNNVLVFKVSSKFDVRRMRELCGGSISPTLTPLRKENMGFCESVSVFEEGNNTYTKFMNNKNVVTIILKDSIMANLDEYERILLKGLTVLEKNVKKGEIRVVEGGGKFEGWLSRVMEEKNMEYGDSRQLVYKGVSNALGKFKVSGCDVYDIYEGKVKSVGYAIDLVCIVLETEDYLLTRGDEMNVKPRMNKNWDD
jgi:T-complex protein 1 subunit theta